VNRLDFSEIMDRDCWWEDYDKYLQCPFCDDGLRSWEGLRSEEQEEVAKAYCEKYEVKKGRRKISRLDLAEEEVGRLDVAEWYNDNRSNFEYTCDECTEGRFEIMWNTAFGVECNADDQDKRRTAWDLGFCLIDHNGRSYLLMGSCGQDNTWRIHYTRWLLQGRYLNDEDCGDCLANWSAHVFLGRKEKKEFLVYLEDRVLDTGSVLQSMSYRGEDAAQVRSKYLTGSKEDREMPVKTFRIRVAKVVSDIREARGRTAAEAFRRLRDELGRSEEVPIRVLDLEEEVEGD
jgi:hypothetical protein